MHYKLMQYSRLSRLFAFSASFVLEESRCFFLLISLRCLEKMVKQKENRIEI